MFDESKIGKNIIKPKVENENMRKKLMSEVGRLNFLIMEASQKIILLQAEVKNIEDSENELIDVDALNKLRDELYFKINEKYELTTQKEIKLAELKRKSNN